MDSKNNPKEIPEHDFFEKRYRHNRKTLWIFLFLFMAVVILLWLFSFWKDQLLAEQRHTKPFLRVSNRDFSLFLWQNPEFNRVHFPNISGYLPDFQCDDDVRVIPEYADEIVQAPPHVLFRYHAWHRLIGDSLGSRPIPADQLQSFLMNCREWCPEYWNEAPHKYSMLIQNLEMMGDTDLAPLPDDLLPFQVRMAFQGWQNHYFEKQEIQAFHPTVGEVKQFLNNHPFYRRTYWKNILENQKLHYLASLENAKSSKTYISQNELTTFLKIGMINLSRDNDKSFFEDRTVFSDW